EGVARGAAWRGFFESLVGACRATTVVTGSGLRLWVCAERLGQVTRVLPDASPEPRIEAVDGVRGAAAGTAEASLVELLRGRLETLGPVTAAALTGPFAIDVNKVNNALQLLELEGFVMRGRFRNLAGNEEEWCERRLLARINRYTIKRLRKQVEPVSPAVYMQFLFAWHEIGAEDAQGPDAVRRALDRLRGFAAPAGAWESALLPVRAHGFVHVYLDELLTSGEFMWLRPGAEARAAPKQGPVRNTPITLVDRAELDVWRPLFARHAESELSSSAQRVRAALREHRATFFSDLVRVTGLLRTQVETALGELVANGLVTSDSFAGLRALITPSAKRASFSRPRRRGRASVDAGGRWSLLDEELSSGTDFSDEAAERIAFALLDRYGVVFRQLLQRESRRLPPWRQLWRIFRRLEARGEVRGGRFVSGFAGEQFAWPDAIDALRRVRRDGRSDTGRQALIAAADPLNLAGIVTPGTRVPATTRNRLLYRDGVPVALYVGGDFQWLGEPDAADEWTARNLLIRNDPQLTYIPGSPRLS
ncbi:MAG: ATP-dependent DNA helicase, partial [Gammaproteobacteria bacterium]